MTVSEIMNVITEFSSDHQILAIIIVFLLAFGESLAFISLLLPATVILLGLGALIGNNQVAFLLIWFSTTIGAFLGDWLSYWIGFHYKQSVRYMWPISRRPAVLEQGHRFFERWGVWSVFIGRFFGPLRAIIPLVAGICAMPKHYFQLANLVSSILWAFAILASGAFGLSWLAKLVE
ncbi:MAG: DedA family protein [Candidatus Arsenophonus melophagi]|nr:DedA family protein [Candidatus Arsenophonus melophagi]